MKKICFLTLCLLQFGCNYSLSKNPLNFSETSGLEGIPDGSIVSFQVISNSIIQKKCLECHSSAGGNLGDVNLETYENVMDNLGTIRGEIEDGRMPKNRPKLSGKQKEILLAWIDAGGPRDGVVLEKIPKQEVEVEVKEDIKEEVKIPEIEIVMEKTPPKEVELINYGRVRDEVIKVRCLQCHSSSGGNAGRLNLQTYENVAAKIDKIEIRIKSGTMPKGKPLTVEQKTLLLDWIAQGAPKE